MSQTWGDASAKLEHTTKENAMTDTKYNGWTNYETWVTKLWMDNDEGSQAYYRELTEEHVKQHGEDSPYELSQILKDDMEESSPMKDTTCGVFADLMNAAISEINFYEIAEHLIEEFKEEQAAA